MTGSVWTWPDALVAAVVALCLVTAFTRLGARSGIGSRRRPVGGPAVAAALVVALAVALLTHDATVARIAVVSVAVAVVVAGPVLRPRRTAGLRRRDERDRPT